MDRRNFISAAIGASAALAADADLAPAQAATASRGTAYTGDVIGGKKVISVLVSGQIASFRTDATSEPGNVLLSVLYNRSSPDGVDPLSE